MDDEISSFLVKMTQDAVTIHQLKSQLADFNGEIPKGMYVLHKCDIGLCVNPLHLFLGTLTDNNRDRENKNRGNHARGERVGGAKLTQSAVVDIKKLYRTGLSQRQLGDKYSVSKQTIGHILRGNTWRHVSFEEVTPTND